MAIVVEQTIPFSPKVLDLENPTRWTTLLPLIRPSVKPITLSNQTILVDTALSSSSKQIRIATIGRLGNFSSKLLESRHICAVAHEAANSGKGEDSLSARDVADALVKGGVSVEEGVVVVRVGRQRRLEVEGKVVEVEVEGGLEADHVLHLVGSVNEGTRYVVLEPESVFGDHLNHWTPGLLVRMALTCIGLL